MSEPLPLKQKYQVLPPMPPEQFAALKADIAERGVLVPIDVDEEGHILDGHHRYRACVDLKITDFSTIVRPGMSEEDRRMFARKSNMLRRHLTREQVRQLIAEQLKDTPNWANSRIAQALGVDDKTVATVRSQMEATSEIPKLDKLIGADGKERSTKRVRQPAITAANLDELKQILDRLAEGVDIDKIEGFHSREDFFTIVDASYDPFAHCDAEGRRQWKLFMLFGVEPHHVEWVLQRQFKDPAEWLGDEGARFRKRCGMSEPSRRFMKAWELFRAKHKNTPESEIDALLDAKWGGKS